MTPDINYKGTWIVTHSVGLGGEFEFTGYITMSHVGVLSLKTLTERDGSVGPVVRVFSPSGWLSVTDKDSESLFPRIVKSEHKL